MLLKLKESPLWILNSLRLPLNWSSFQFLQMLSGVVAFFCVVEVDRGSTYIKQNTGFKNQYHLQMEVKRENLLHIFLFNAAAYLGLGYHHYLFSWHDKTTLEYLIINVIVLKFYPHKVLYSKITSANIFNSHFTIDVVHYPMLLSL